MQNMKLNGLNQLEVYSNGLKKSFSIEWPFCFINIMGEKNNQ